jgi:hypothetical protein
MAKGGRTKEQFMSRTTSRSTWQRERESRPAMHARTGLVELGLVTHSLVLLPFLLLLIEEHCSLSLSLYYCRWQGDSIATCSLLSPQPTVCPSTSALFPARFVGHPIWILKHASLLLAFALICLLSFAFQQLTCYMSYKLTASSIIFFLRSYCIPLLRGFANFNRFKVGGGTRISSTTKKVRCGFKRRTQPFWCTVNNLIGRTNIDTCGLEVSLLC